MGRPPCCDKVGVKKGPWTPEEDIILVSYIQEHGPGNWRSVPTNTGEQPESFTIFLFSFFPFSFFSGLEPTGLQIGFVLCNDLFLVCKCKREHFPQLYLGL